MKVEFKKSFAKDLKATKDPDLLDRVKELIETVEKTEIFSQIAGLKKLKGRGNFFRLRVGDYRLGLVLEDDTVILCGS